MRTIRCLIFQIENNVFMDTEVGYFYQFLVTSRVTNLSYSPSFIQKKKIESKYNYCCSKVNLCIKEDEVCYQLNNKSYLIITAFPYLLFSSQSA